MIKLIPLIIFPLSFFLIFLGVRNLTDNFPLDKEKFIKNNKEEIINNSQDSEEIETKIVTEAEQNLIDVDENLTNTEEIEKRSSVKLKEKKSIEKNKPLVKSEKIESSSKKSQKKTINIPIAKEKNIYLIQFGAFSKKKNAEDFKNSIVEKLGPKFPGFLINLDFDEKKKLYKLISQTNDINKAKRVCGYSKKMKINCLFKKQ